MIFWRPVLISEDISPASACTGQWKEQTKLWFLGPDHGPMTFHICSFGSLCDFKTVQSGAEQQGTNPQRRPTSLRHLNLWTKELHSPVEEQLTPPTPDGRAEVQ